MDKTDKKKQLKMPVRPSATSQKAAGKTANAEAFVDLKPAKVGINPKLLCVSSVNYFRPGWAKASVAPKDFFSEKEFKDLEKAQTDNLGAITHAIKLQIANAVKQAGEKKLVHVRLSAYKTLAK